MKTRMTRLLTVLMAAVMLLSLAGCQSNNEKPADAAETNRDAIAAKVGDEYTVTLGEVEDAYSASVQQYQAYGMSAPTADADIESMQDYVVQDLVSAKVKQYQAKLMGIQLDEDAKKGVDADIEDEMAYWMDTFRTQAESEGATDVDARATEIFNEELKNSGLDMDVDAYRDYIRGFIETEAINKALEEKVKSEVSVSDEEIQTHYDDLLAKQKEAYATAPEGYLEDEENFEKFGGDPVLVVPEGYVRVRTITISPAEALDEGFETLKTELTALESEYGKLSLDSALKNPVRLTEIVKEYAEKKAESDKLYEEYIAAAKEKAGKAYAALQGGKSFSDVMQEFGEDDVYTTYPIFATEGLLMQKGVASSTWDQKLVDAVGKLQPGQYTDLIQLEDMFYICELVGDEEVVEKPLSDVKDSITEQTTNAKAETYWNEQLEAWLNDTKLVTYFEDVYRGVGKQAA